MSTVGTAGTPRVTVNRDAKSFDYLEIEFSSPDGMYAAFQTSSKSCCIERLVTHAFYLRYETLQVKLSESSRPVKRAQHLAISSLHSLLV